MRPSEVLGLSLEVGVVKGQTSPVTYLPVEDPGSGTYARVADTGQGPLGKHRGALEVAGMFGSSPGGVEPTSGRIVVFAELGCALECSRGRSLTAALGKARGGRLESRGD